MDNTTDIEQLKGTVALLEKDIRRLADQLSALVALTGSTASQLTYPIDPLSRSIINQNKPVFISRTAGSAGTNGYILVDIDGVTHKLMTTA